MGIVIAIFKYKQWPLPVIFAAPQCDFRIHRAGDSGGRDDSRAAGQCRQTG